MFWGYWLPHWVVDDLFTNPPDKSPSKTTCKNLACLGLLAIMIRHWVAAVTSTSFLLMNIRLKPSNNAIHLLSSFHRQQSALSTLFNSAGRRMSKWIDFLKEWSPSSQCETIPSVDNECNILTQISLHTCMRWAFLCLVLSLSISTNGLFF